MRLKPRCVFFSSTFFFTYTNVYLVQQTGPPSLQTRVGGPFSFILPIQYTLHDPQTSPSLQMRVGGVVFFHNSYSVPPTQQTGPPLLQTRVGGLFSFIFPIQYTLHDKRTHPRYKRESVGRY